LREFFLRSKAYLVAPDVMVASFLFFDFARFYVGLWLGFPASMSFLLSLIEGGF